MTVGNSKFDLKQFHEFSAESFVDQLERAVDELVRKVMAQREKILEAFIAETGLLHSECEMIQQSFPDGTIRWWVQRRKP